MAELHELIEKIENPELRAQIAEAGETCIKTQTVWPGVRGTSAGVYAPV